MVFRILPALQYGCTSMPPWNTANYIDISRPARPDYYSGYPTGLWFLGNGITADGSYNAQTLFTPGAANGAPESPTYVITAGSTKLSLSCTNCANPTATAIGASGGCQTYDVVVNTSYNGFLSDPFYLFINRPWNLVASTDPTHGTWVYSYPLNNGYATYIWYKASGLCLNDASMSGYDLNEQFSGNWIPDIPGENWPPTTTAGTYYAPPGTPTWADQVYISNPGSSPGDQAYCGNGVLCSPQWTNPGGGPHTLVDHVPQSWFIGSGTSGVGARVQSDTVQRYTDSAWHTDIVTPSP
jgi:hypothetical protein